MKNKNMSQCLQKKLSMSLELDGVPRYYMKKISWYRYREPVTVLKKYRGILVHGTAHHCQSVILRIRLDRNSATNVERGTCNCRCRGEPLATCVRFCQIYRTRGGSTNHYTNAGMASMSIDRIGF